MKKPVMTPEQFTFFSSFDGSKSHTAAQWDEYNNLRDNFIPPVQTPAIGTPCTYGIGSDRYAGEVVEVARNGRRIGVVLKGHQTPDYFTYRPRDGRYRSEGASCGTLTIGVAVEYLDPSF